MLYTVQKFGIGNIFLNAHRGNYLIKNIIKTENVLNIGLILQIYFTIWQIWIFSSIIPVFMMIVQKYFFINVYELYQCWKLLNWPIFCENRFDEYKFQNNIINVFTVTIFPDWIWPFWMKIWISLKTKNLLTPHLLNGVAFLNQLSLLYRLVNFSRKWGWFKLDISCLTK